jgi:hypothetical protein
MRSHQLREQLVGSGGVLAVEFLVKNLNRLVFENDRQFWSLGTFTRLLPAALFEIFAFGRLVTKVWLSDTICIKAASFVQHGISETPPVNLY